MIMQQSNSRKALALRSTLPDFATKASAVDEVDCGPLCHSGYHRAWTCLLVNTAMQILIISHR